LSLSAIDDPVVDQANMPERGKRVEKPHSPEFVDALRFFPAPSRGRGIQFALVNSPLH
jgi:hypothetical protein